MNDLKAKDLLQKYAEGKCSEEEMVLFETWYNGLNSSNRILISEEELKGAEEEMLRRLTLATKPRGPIKLWLRISVAASILATISLVGYFLASKKHKNETIVSIGNANIKPGGNKAILTLSNGKQISLTDAKAGNMDTGELSFINKTDEGKVVYKAGSPEDGTEPTYNTISTPRGGKFQVVLPDGSNVWLNAESSITFPTRFIGKSREVRMTGEAYFEVVHDLARPFRVTSANQYTEVLGTHFNINAYDDEPLARTTLLEGRIKLIKAGNNKILAPGQQAETERNSSSSEVLIKTVPDMQQVIAWKNGLFKFNNTDFKEVLRQVSRWYDVKVEYEEEIPDRLFSGEITRNVNLSDVLEILSYLKINFKIKQTTQGSTIIVTQ